MSEPSQNGSPNGNGVPTSDPLARRPGETATAHTNRVTAARAEQERAHLAALTSQAAQLVETLQGVAAAIPPDLSAQLAAVRSETQEARSAAAEVRIAATSSGATVERSAQQFEQATAEAREWHAALTGIEARLTQIAQAAERTAATSYQRAASMVAQLGLRVWAMATGSNVAALLLLALGVWLGRATVARWLMTEEQKREHYNGQVAEAVYLNPNLPAAQRCAFEAAMNWPHRGPGRCPTPTTGPGSSKR